jgi:catechol 2,3-dioxygenase-like lactoylglutathione lyase family enzyme
MSRGLKVLLALITFRLTFGSAHARAGATKPGVTAVWYVTVLVKDYDQALAWYTGILGLEKVGDRNFGPTRRWLVVAPAGKSRLGIVLEVPNADGSRAGRIGKETNWVFEVADCAKFYDSLRAHGVHFTDPPKRMPWGTTQAVFEDPYGNIFVAESPALAKTADYPDSQ